MTSVTIHPHANADYVIWIQLICGAPNVELLSSDIPVSQEVIPIAWTSLPLHQLLMSLHNCLHRNPDMQQRQDTKPKVLRDVWGKHCTCTSCLLVLWPMAWETFLIHMLVLIIDDESNRWLSNQTFHYKVTSATSLCIWSTGISLFRGVNPAGPYNSTFPRVIRAERTPIPTISKKSPNCTAHRFFFFFFPFQIKIRH